MKKYNVEAVENALRTRLQEALNKGHGGITVTMKCNGDPIYITPCFWDLDETDINKADFFLVDSSTFPWLGAEKIAKVAEELANYEELINEREEDIVKLAKHYKEYGYDEITSDWYKDLFGHRPRGNALDILVEKVGC